MKTTRKLIPALVMLLVSAIMLSTASYAWFASSYNVTAEEMHVKVKSNARFLEMALVTDGVAGEYGKSVVIGNDDRDGEGNLTEGWIELIHASFDEDGNLSWKQGTSSDYDGVGSVDRDAVVGETTALMRTLSVRMSPTSTDDLHELTIDTVTITDAEGNEPSNALAHALRILVVAKGTNEEDETVVLGSQIYDPGNGRTEAAKLDTYSADDDADYLIPTVELGEEYTLEVYIFFDGEDADATTANTTGLQELVVTFSLTAATVSA